jgi:hypothetical protein
MNPLSLDAVVEYVGNNIADFHERRAKSLEGLRLTRLINKNPYLFRAKHVTTAGELMEGLLDAFLSSSEEKLFGDFLENLAIYVAEQTCSGHKSTAPGIDMEFFNNGIHYIVSVKSGPNWGNSSQQRRLEQDLRDAVARVKQSQRALNVQPVLGICYGKTKTSYIRGYLKVVGQNFWYLISENKDLYTDIVEPIGYQAKEYNEAFATKKVRVINLLTKEFLNEFCNEVGAIDWPKLVEFNSGNYDLDAFLP